MMLYNEVSVHTKLKHPYIVDVHDWTIDRSTRTMVRASDSIDHQTHRHGASSQLTTPRLGKTVSAAPQHLSSPPFVQWMVLHYAPGGSLVRL